MAAPPDFLIVDSPTAGLQRLRAGFAGHAYDRHRRETYAVGVTETGLQCFHYRGAARASTPRQVIVIHPDEVHDGPCRRADRVRIQHFMSIPSEEA